MAAKRLSHTEVEYLINLWHNEPVAVGQH